MVIHRFLLLKLLCFCTISVIGQLTLQNPQICHDKDKFLKCYNDGTYILKFSSGDFVEFRTTDSSIFYLNTNKTFTLYRESYYGAKTIDTIQLKLLPKSILITRRNKSLELTSLSQIRSAIYEFGVGYYGMGQSIEGFAFFLKDKEIHIPVYTYGKIWSWDIRMYYKNQFFKILYNSYKKNRLMHIFIQDTAQKYGMGISTTYRSLKNISLLESIYVDTMTINGRTFMGEYKLDKSYRYSYDKAGKLSSKQFCGEIKLCGEIKICDCD